MKKSIDRLWMDSVEKSYDHPWFTLILIAIISLSMFSFLDELRIDTSSEGLLIPMVLAMGMIPILEIPVDLFTVLIGNIAMGLIVDDTIHFFHHFNCHYRITGNRRQSIMMIYESTGASMVFTSVVLSLGFLTFTLSPMNNFFHFGLLTSIIIVLALISDLVITPSVIMIAYKDKHQGEKDGHSKNENQQGV